MLRLIRAVTTSVALGALSMATACGGGNDGATPTPTPAPPPPSPPVTAQNPCPASSLAPATEIQSGLPRRVKPSGSIGDADPRGTLADVLWKHRAAQGRLAPSAVITPRATEDIGDVAVIQDEGDLVAPANTFDLQLTGLRYVPRAGGGYDVSRTESSFRAALGDRVTLSDDDMVAKTLAFGFSFYGSRQTIAFVNSDGNITFGEGDKASTARSVSRLLSGAPRVAPLFADLDPSAGGMVFVRAGRRGAQINRQEDTGVPGEIPTTPSTAVRDR
ncbi:MAG TPA: hypothetical protein VI485_00305 [Vicinamibacterales bacterium]|nr:hypothetical protein [Vicinamibacterales bacterium]